MFKKVLAAIAVLGVFYSAIGQNVEGVNARLDAMGGCGVVGDIGWTIGKPSSLYGYADQVQASGLIITIEGLGKTYGSIIAIKSLGEHFFVGMTMNGRKAMSGTFYKKAIEYGDFGENFNFLTQPGQYFPVYPHLNINYKPSDNLSIGIGGYFEHSKHDEQKTKNIVYSHEVGGNPVENMMHYDSTRLKKYTGIGLIADARIWFGGFKLNPEFKIFIPKLDGRVETNQDEKFNKNHNVTQPLTVADIENRAKTTDLSKNLFLRAGTKFSGTIAETFWILGLWYRTERFEIERNITLTSTIMDYNTADITDTITTSTKFHAHKKTRYDWWLGAQPSFSDNLIICPEYSGFVQVREITPSSGYTEDTTTVRIKHKFRLGAEQSIKGFWIFKELFLRMGINYYLTRDFWKNKNGLTSMDSTTEEIYWPYSSNNDLDLVDDGKGAKVTAGFGLKGKRGTFDLSLDVLNWSNTGITGPGAAIATFGLDFGRKQEE